MDFNVETTNFPSIIHKQIYFSARGITPLERSIETIPDVEFRLSCIDYHSFILNLFSDMYEHPDEYALPVGQLERYCGNNKVNAMKQKYPSKTKRILAYSSNPDRNYTSLLHWFGCKGTIDGNTLLVPSQDIEALCLRSSLISYEKRIKALTRVGFILSNGRITSIHFPNIFSAMCALAQRAEKQSGFDFFAFCNVDFRNIFCKYRPTYEDYFRLLFYDQRNVAYQLHEYAAQNKIKPTVNTYWKVDYMYKGMKVMFLAVHDCKLCIQIVGIAGGYDPALINYYLSKESPAFQKQALRHIRRCDACATTHLGTFITVLGKKQRVCGGGEVAFRWYNPHKDDLEIIKRLIQFRMNIIDELKGSP